MLVHAFRRSLAATVRHALLAFAATLALAASALASPDCPAPEITSLSPPVVPAAGGVHLTISGNHFLSGGSAKVSIGLTSPAVVSMTDTQIVVVAPPQQDEAEPEVRVVKALRPHPNVVHRLQYAPPSVLPGGDVTVRRGGGPRLTISGSNFTCSAPGAYLLSGTGSTCPARVIALTDTTVVIEPGDCDDGDPTAELHVTFAHRNGIVHRDLACRNVLLQGGRAPTLSHTSVPSCGGTTLTINGQDFTGSSGAPPRPQLCRDGTCRDMLVLSSTPTRIVAVSPPLSEAPLTAPASVRVITDGIPGAGCPLELTAQPVLHKLHAAALPAAGGYPLTIRGDNFADGASVRVGGIAGGVIAAIVVAARTITCVSPPLSPGMTTIEVLQDGFVSASLPIEVVGPPQVSQVSPSSLGAQGGVRLTVVGQGFGPPSAFHSVSVQVQQEGSAPVDCGPVRWAGSNTLECRAPQGVEGAADVIVTVNGISGVMANAFDYLPASPPAAPVLSGSVPQVLSRAGGSLITLTGSNFVSPTENTVVRCGQQLVTPALLTANLLTFVQPALEEGEDHVPVEVRMGNVNSNPLYNDKGLSGTNPLAGSQYSSHSGGTVITITGSDFGAEARVVCSSSSGESHVSSPLSVSPNEIRFSSPEFATTGDVSVRVEHGTQQSNSQSLPYVGPLLEGVSAEEVSPAGGTVITLMGSNFGAVPGRVSFGPDEVEVSSWSPTEIVCAVAPRPVGRPSSPPLRITDDDGSASRQIPIRWSAPEVLNVDVPAATAGGGTSITVRGRDFSPYATLEWADGLPGPSFTVTDRSPTSFAVLLGNGSAGGRLLSLDGASEPIGAPLPFELLAPPELSSVSPPAGPIAGGNTITIFGSSFGPPGTKRSVHFAGTDDCPMAVTDEFSDRITCLVPPGSGAGTRDLVVVVDGVADTLVGAYEYSATAGVPGGASPRAALALAALRSPFASELTLRLTLPHAGRWQLQLFDARGAHVRKLEGDAPAGTFDVRWNGRAADGRAAAPGVYFARLTSGGVTRETRAVKLQ